MQGRQSYLEYIEDLQDSSGLTVYEERGKVKCYFRKTYQSSDIQHQFTIQNSIAIKMIGNRNSDRYNRFTLKYGQYVDEALQEPSLDSNAVTVIDNTYIAEDLLQDSEGTIDCPFLATFYVETTSGTLSYDNSFDGSPVVDELSEYADFLLDKSRLSDDVEIETTYEYAKALNLGQPFSVNTEKYGWTGLNERIYVATEITDNHDGTIVIVGQQHSNELLGGEDNYPGIISEQVPPIVGKYTGVFLPLRPSTPLTLTAAWDAGDRAVNLAWTVLPVGPVVSYLVEYKLSTETDTAYKALPVTTNLVSQHYPGSNAGVYIYRVTTIGEGNIKSLPFTSSTLDITSAISAASSIDVAYDRNGVIFSEATANVYTPASISVTLDVRRGGTVQNLVPPSTTDALLLEGDWKYVSKTETGVFDVLPVHNLVTNKLITGITNFQSEGDFSLTIKTRVNDIIVEYDRSVSVGVASQGVKGILGPKGDVGVAAYRPDILVTSGTSAFNNGVGSGEMKAVLYKGGVQTTDKGATGSLISHYNWYHSKSGGAYTRLLNADVASLTGTLLNAGLGGSTVNFDHHTLVCEADGTLLGGTLQSGSVEWRCDIDFTPS